MKKILSVFAAASLLFACDPVHEDFSNDGHIDIAQLRSQFTVTVDKAASGKNGNVITCNTSAPVNAMWTIGGKDFYSNYATKKMKLGNHLVVITALCADGTTLKDTVEVTCEEITDPLTKYWIYGEPGTGQEPLVLNAGDAGAGRFSDNEGKGLPYLSDEIYWGFKTLMLDIEATPGDAGIWGEPAGPAMVRVMNGWWSTAYQDELELETGLWELQLTEDIAKDCARGNGGSGKDLDILVRRGTVTINSVYYEE